jgi:hypothetical protein
VPPVAGMLCESPLGWPSVFYCFGSMTIAAFLLFHWLFRDNPHKHRFSRNNFRLTLLFTSFEEK